MITATEEFAAAIGRSSRSFRARLLEGSTVLGGEIRRATVHLGSCGASAFTPGAVFSSYAEIVVAEPGLTFEGRSLKLQLGVKPAGFGWEYVTIGCFTAGRPSTSVFETTFLAVGSIAARFSGAFAPPAELSVSEVIAALETQTGTSIVLRGLTAAGTIEKALTGLTCRQALGVVAGVLGGYATERNDGAVVIAKYTGTATASADGSRMTAPPTFGDSDSTITGVRVTVPADGTTEQAVYESGTVNLERTDAYMTQALFPAYAANLTGLTYRAGTAKLALGDPRLEPWDVLAVTDMAARTFALPCMSIVHTFDGGLATEVRAPALSEATEILGAAGAAIRSAQEAANAASAAAEAAQETADAAGERLAAWAYANDTTKIDGGRIYTGTIDTHGLHLYGEMTLFRDDTSFEASNKGGSLGYMDGRHGFADGTTELTPGMAMVRERAASTDAATGVTTPAATHYLIVTDAGVRLQENIGRNSHSAYLADGCFIVPEGTKLIADGGLYRNGNTPWFADALWVNSDPTASFSPATVVDDRISEYGILVFEIAWSASNSGVVNSAVVCRAINAPPQGSIIAQPSVVWYDGGGVSAAFRPFRIDGNRVEIGSGCHATVSGVSVSADSYAIPLRIMGIAT